jgi:hypothetical protein
MVRRSSLFPGVRTNLNVRGLKQSATLAMNREERPIHPGPTISDPFPRQGVLCPPSQDRPVHRSHREPAADAPFWVECYNFPSGKTGLQGTTSLRRDSNDGFTR